MILGGSPGLSGAPALAARAALRTGAGLVTVGVPRALNDILEIKLTEAMTWPLPGDDLGHFTPLASAALLKGIGRFDVVAVGPGLGTDSGAAALLNGLLANVQVPLVLDADALNIVARRPEGPVELAVPWVMTPHPGELARLLKVTAAEVQADRISISERFLELFPDGVLVLKGHETLVRDSQRIYINTTGNPGMASGGSGDVLTGMVGALVAQGLGVFDAAVLGVHLHGLAGDLAAKERTEPGMIAGDIIDNIPGALRKFGVK